MNKSKAHKVGYPHLHDQIGEQKRSRWSFINRCNADIFPRIPSLKEQVALSKPKIRVLGDICLDTLEVGRVENATRCGGQRYGHRSIFAICRLGRDAVLRSDRD